MPENQDSKNRAHIQKSHAKKLGFKGQISALVVQAMSEIGQANLKPTEEEEIIKLLKKEKYEDLKHDIRFAPQWIAEVMVKAL